MSEHAKQPAPAVVQPAVSKVDLMIGDVRKLAELDPAGMEQVWNLARAKIAAKTGQFVPAPAQQPRPGPPPPPS